MTILNTSPVSAFVNYINAMKYPKYLQVFADVGNPIIY